MGPNAYREQHRTRPRAIGGTDTRAGAVDKKRSEEAPSWLKNCRIAIVALVLYYLRQAGPMNRNTEVGTPFAGNKRQREAPFNDVGDCFPVASFSLSTSDTQLFEREFSPIHQRARPHHGTVAVWGGVPASLMPLHDFGFDDNPHANSSYYHQEDFDHANFFSSDVPENQGDQCQDEQSHSQSQSHAHINDTSLKQTNRQEINISNPPKKSRQRYCTYEACTAYARETLTRRCIAHGGGRRCAVRGCTRQSADSRRNLATPGFCKAHGGGRRCIVKGCSTSARTPSEYCRKHQRGTPEEQSGAPVHRRKCDDESGCEKFAQHGTHYCIAHFRFGSCVEPGCIERAPARVDGKSKCYLHGSTYPFSQTRWASLQRARSQKPTSGSDPSASQAKRRRTERQRCVVDGCTRFARESKSGRCIGHGGGRRCTTSGCSKSAIDKFGKCATHSEFKQCQVQGCPKVGRPKYCQSHSYQAYSFAQAHQYFPQTHQANHEGMTLTHPSLEIHPPQIE